MKDENDTNIHETLDKLNILVDSLANSPEAWRLPEQALIRIIETTLGELCYIINKRRT